MLQLWLGYRRKLKDYPYLDMLQLWLGLFRCLSVLLVQQSSFSPNQNCGLYSRSNVRLDASHVCHLTLKKQSSSFRSWCLPRLTLFRTLLLLTSWRKTCIRGGMAKCQTAGVHRGMIPPKLTSLYKKLQTTYLYNSDPISNNQIPETDLTKCKEIEGMYQTQFEEWCNKNSPRGQLYLWSTRLVHPVCLEIVGDRPSPVWRMMQHEQPRGSSIAVRFG